MPHPYITYLSTKLAFKQNLNALQKLRESLNVTPFNVKRDSPTNTKSVGRLVTKPSVSKDLSKLTSTQDTSKSRENEVSSDNFIPITNEVILPDKLIIERGSNNSSTYTPPVVASAKSNSSFIDINRKGNIISQDKTFLSMSAATDLLHFKKGDKKVGIVMKEFKQGKLKSSSGKKVKNPKQALAIALSEMKKARK